MTRSRAERDAVTVEIAYALLTGALLAGAAGLLAASPVLLFDLDGSARKTVTVVALVLAAAVLLWRLAGVLWGFDPRRRSGPGGGPRG
ncbi:hypothetical protein CUT44_12155 [Streptomyces carminius]|uniref:Uncharacterized protein n=1 Tax=Streptomyces carminius TaxID=2665496 RepID=A0A2M8LZR0_9ACTN|nr:DUF6332 family protein [Streptomyces carminius]PJE97431.1 hypothetical protein CUT44_12155 [Streptomyces carminius]